MVFDGIGNIEEYDMKTIHVLKGLPGSGKSTYALEQLRKHPGKIKRVNKDDLRRMLDGVGDDFEEEKIVLSIRDFIIEKALASDFDVIVDDTNFKDKHFYAICDCAKRVGNVRVYEKFFDVELKTALERNSKRPKPVPEGIIRQMWETNIKGKKIETRDLYFGFKNEYYTQINVASDKKAIIVDVDGTLALNLSNRDYYDSDRFEDDTLNVVIADLVRLYHDAGHAILIVSGREFNKFEVTKNWLQKYNVPHEMLLMRETGDSRSDTIVKKEIYEKFIKDKYDVMFAVDDRRKVVRMWREQLEIPVLQLDDVDF
jgi:predicted kinase